MDAATLNTDPGTPSAAGSIRKIVVRLAGLMDELSVAEKIYGIAAGLVVVTLALLVMSTQTMRLQAGYRHLQASSAQAATNVGRVNGLIYAIVMESRGIYMSTDPVKAKKFGDELLNRTNDLAKVMVNWEEVVRSDDAELFAAFQRRIDQFIEFRRELVRRAGEISPAAGREWGDNDANRALKPAQRRSRGACADLR